MTTALAPTTQPSPMVTPGSTTTPIPSHVPEPTRTGRGGVIAQLNLGGPGSPRSCGASQLS